MTAKCDGKILTTICTPGKIVQPRQWEPREPSSNVTIPGYPLGYPPMSFV